VIRPLILMNVILLASIPLHLMTTMIHTIASPGSLHDPMLNMYWLSSVILPVCAYGLGWFYAFFISLLLLSLSMVTGHMRKRIELSRDD
jgi:hypothetical protein